MSKIELVAPCHFGLEAVLKKEILDLGYEIVRVEDGRVTFAGDEDAICRANIFLRTAERILLKVGQLHAVTFDELFEGIKALPRENYIPSDGKYWVAKASSVKSKQFRPSDIYCEKGNRGASERGILSAVVSRDWCRVSHQNFLYEGRGSCLPGYDGTVFT